MSTVQLDVTSQAPPASPMRPELASKSSSRATKDLLARVVMWAAFFIAVVPLVWILGGTDKDELRSLLSRRRPYTDVA